MSVRDPRAAAPPVGRWRILLLLAMAQFLGMSLWFTASAVAPQLQGLWALSTQQTGWLVGALTLGKATPYLTRALEGASLQPVVLTASAGALVAALLVGTGYRDEPFPFTRRPFSWHLAGTVVRHRPTRLAIGGYLGHMWELYAVWTWIPAFLAASALAIQSGPVPSPRMVDVAAFGAIASGALGCVAGGWAADRIGRAAWVNLSMAVSGACCLVAGFFFGGSFWLLALLAWVWGFFIVADSAQFSAMVTEVAPSHAVGTALTLQTSLGFLLTIVTIQGVPMVVAAAGWEWAFAVLALGPAFGIVAIQRFRRSTEAGIAAGPEPHTATGRHES